MSNSRQRFDHRSITSPAPPSAPVAAQAPRAHRRAIAAAGTRRCRAPGARPSIRRPPRITQLSNEISAGGDQPSAMVQLTAASLRMQFMSNNAATSQNSVGQALETLGKRQ